MRTAQMTSQFRVGINIFFIFFIHFSFLNPSKVYAGFTYNVTCHDALEENSGTIEVFKQNMPQKIWPIGVKSNFSIMELNFLNMITERKSGNNDSYKQYGKPLAQLEGLARVFKKYLPVLAFCVEVGSVDLLKAFDQEFLNDQYQEFLIKGNDERGINLGLLLRKDLPLDIEIHSHKNLIDETTGEKVFSRDLPVYIIREKNVKKPLLIIFGTHFKSQRSSEGDPNSFDKRLMQVEAAKFLISDYEKRFSDSPIILTGDFNNDVRIAPEFKPLKKMGLVDSFDLANDSVENSQRGTHYYFPHHGYMTVSQLDSILLNQTAVKKKIVKSAKVISHIDPDGNEYPPPRTRDERAQRGSDHLPVISVFDLTDSN